MLEWQKEIGLAVLLGLVTFATYGFLFEEGAVPYSQHSDLVAVHLSVKHAAYAAMQAGEGLPFWRSDMLSGGPALTHPQAIYTNPLQWPFLFMEPASASGPSIWLHFLVMALSMQVLGGVLRLSWLARAFMAIAGLFSFKLIIITYAGWLPVLPGLVTAPLLMAGFIKAIEEPGLLSALLLTVGLGLAIQSGHLQTSYYVGGFFGLYLLARCIRWIRAQEASHARQVMVTSSAALTLALLSSAFLMLPLFAELEFSARSASDYDFHQSGGAFKAQNLATFLHPEILGSPIDGSYEPVELWENVAYFGAIAQLLALLGVLLGHRRPYVRFFAIGLFSSIALSFDSIVLRALYDFVPGFSLFRIPSRFLFITTLFGIALSGVGFDEVVARIRARVSPSVAPRVAVALAGTLLAVTVWEGTRYVERYITMAPIAEVMPSTKYADFLASDDTVFRVAPIRRDTMNYGWGAMMGLELITGFEPYNYRHYLQYVGTLTDNVVIDPIPLMWIDVARIARWDLFNAMNAKYILAAKELEVVPDHLSLVAQFDDEPVFGFYQERSTTPIFVYENNHVRGRAHWAGDLVFVDSPKKAANVSLKVNLNYRTVVESTPEGPRVSIRTPGDTLRVSKPRDGELILHANSKKGGFAVISEVWHPGWSASLDGEPIEIHRTNVALMGFYIPIGQHEVVVSFRPLYFDTALVLTGIGLAGTVVLAGAAVYRGRRKWEGSP